MIIAPNHFSFLDHFFVAVYLRRKVHFMAKSQLFKPPMQFIYTHGGVFPVRRGHQDEEAFVTAETVLARGDIVVMYAEAGRSRTRRAGQAAPRSRAAGARVGRARSCRRRSRAPSGCATGGACSSPRSRCSSASRSASSSSTDPTRDQAQAASEVVFDRVREIHGRLCTDGRREAVRAARAARTSP